MNLSKHFTPSALVSFAGVGILIACGPFYAPRLLNQKNTIISNPATGVELMFPNNKKERQPHRHLKELPERLRATFEADLADLKLAAPNLPEDVFNAYSEIRKDMILSSWDQPAVALKGDRPGVWIDEAVLAAIPREFSIYLRGAIDYRAGHYDKARDHWKSLLALPADERKHRTIWAAWMLARTSTAKGEAMKWYTQVKQFKQDGFPDSIHVTDKDWTGFFSLKSKDYATALSVYLKRGQDHSDDPISTANNISEVFTQALIENSEDQTGLFNSFAKSKEHAIAFSYFLSRESLSSRHIYINKQRVDYDPHQEALKLWLKALKESKRPDIDKELGICAASIGIGHGELKGLFLDSIRLPNTESLWSQAKLAALKGNLTEASSYYQRTIELIKEEGASTESIDPFPGRTYRATGELAEERLFNLYSEYACVELGRKNYHKSLDLFLIVNNKRDASYIAETILSPVELLGYVRNSEIARQSPWIKNLLKRKLIRHEYFKDAKKLALEEDLKIYDAYISHYRKGLNESLPKETRSQAFVEAAKILKRHGGSLFYLENDCRPFLRISVAGQKTHEKYDYTKYYSPLPSAQEITPPISPDELQRIQQNYERISPVSTSERYSAELLYRAAMLLPRNDDRTARLLWQAGSDTKHDPQIADKYYKALVRRCSQTALGKACDERRWFVHDPDLKDQN